MLFLVKGFYSMTVKLLNDDFIRLSNILQDLPETLTSRSRYDLLVAIFGQMDRGKPLVSRIDVEGDKRSFTTRLIHHLAQFGQPTQGREALGILIDHLLADRGTDEVADFLAGLVSQYHMNNPILTSAILDTPQIVTGAEEHYIFMSYAHADKAVADVVEKYIEKAGFSLFRDIHMPSGVDWNMTIEDALTKADRMVLLLSASSMPYRKEVYREWFAFDQMGKRLHPLYIQDCTLHSRMLSRNYLDARTDLSGALAQLIIDLGA